MTIRHLKIFETVARTLNMSQAARELYISQPTVSQVISELEEHYGTKLFERLSKKLYLTKSGEKLFNSAKQLLAQFNNMENMMTIRQIEKLDIGATITIGTCILPNLIKQINIEFPKIETYSFISNTAEIEQKLLNSELDIGIIEGEIKSKDLISIPVIEDYLVMACGRNCNLYGKRDININDIANCSFAVRETGSGTRELFDNYLEKNRISVKISWESNSTEAIKNVVKNTEYLTAMSVRLFEDDINDKDIYLIKSNSKELNRSFKFVYHKDKYVTPAIVTLKNILLNYKKDDFLREVECVKILDEI